METKYQKSPGKYFLKYKKGWIMVNFDIENRRNLWYNICEVKEMSIFGIIEMIFVGVGILTIAVMILSAIVGAIFDREKFFKEKRWF